MPLAPLRGAALAVLCLLAGACSSSDDDDDVPPVAEPSVVVPERATAGRSFAVTYRFVVPADAPALSDDYTVFVHVMDESATRLWTADHQPPTPTTRWQRGSVVEYTRRVWVPRSVAGGRVTLQLGLYLPETGERLPLAGERVEHRSYRVAALQVVPEPARQKDVFFTDGWHGVEAPDGLQGLEWRWSGPNATVWLRNPKRDSVVVLELDQPVTLATGPQQVEVRIGGDLVDAFAVPPSQHLVRDILVPVARLGDTEFAQLTVRVDPMFVPAQIGQGTADERELGVRVFSIVIEPKADGSNASSRP